MTNAGGADRVPGSRGVSDRRLKGTEGCFSTMRARKTERLLPSTNRNKATGRSNAGDQGGIVFPTAQKGKRTPLARKSNISKTSWWIIMPDS